MFCILLELNGSVAWVVNGSLNESVLNGSAKLFFSKVDGTLA